MRTNEVYVARHTFVTVDKDGVQTVIHGGRKYIASRFDSLIDTVDGSVFTVALHVARNPLWYFQNGLASFPEVTHEEYIKEVVRGAPEGIDFAGIWETVRCEGFGAFFLRTPVNEDRGAHSLSATLTRCHFEMRKDGVVQRGVKPRRDCTFHHRGSKLK